MGNASGKNRRTKEQQKVASQNITTATNSVQQKIQNVQTYVIDQYQQTSRSSTEQISVVDNKNFVKIVSITETAKNQLQREGGPLTKADLLAIVIALDPVYQKHLDTLEKNTTKDLNALIRTIIYDPSRYTSYFEDKSSKEDQLENSTFLYEEESEKTKRASLYNESFTPTNNSLVIRPSNSMSMVEKPPSKPRRKNSSNSNTSSIVPYSPRPKEEESLMTTLVVPYSSKFEQNEANGTSAFVKYSPPKQVKKETSKSTTLVTYLDPSKNKTISKTSSDPQKDINIFRIR